MHNLQNLLEIEGMLLQVDILSGDLTANDFHIFDLHQLKSESSLEILDDIILWLF